MNHDIGCTDPTVIVQPQLGKRLPVIAQCTTCGAVETRTPTRHRPGEVCRPGGRCCPQGPDTIPHAWQPTATPPKRAVPIVRPPAPTTTTEDPDATPI